MSPGVACFRVGPKPGDVGRVALKSGPLPVGAIGQFPTPFSPETSNKNPAETSENAPHDILTRSRNPDFRISPTMSPEISYIRVGPKSGDLRAGRLPSAGPRQSAQLVNFRTPYSPEARCKTRDGDVRQRAGGRPRPGARFGKIRWPPACRLPPAARFWLPPASHTF